ncbi:MAG: hypothetical protein ACPG8W_21650 [Candidatus Promineifilaceae bacterium]
MSETKQIGPITLSAGKTLQVINDEEVAIDKTVGVVQIEGSNHNYMVSININGEPSAVANVGGSVDFGQKGGYILNASGETVTLTA